jgi:ABC-type antimicrobial peptide transport system ATPase subunit
LEDVLVFDILEYDHLQTQKIMQMQQLQNMIPRTNLPPRLFIGEIVQRTNVVFKISQILTRNLRDREPGTVCQKSFRKTNHLSEQVFQFGFFWVFRALLEQQITITRQELRRLGRAFRLDRHIVLVDERRACLNDYIKINIIMLILEY